MSFKKLIKKITLSFLIITSLTAVFAGCSDKEGGYQSVSAQEAKKLMDESEGYIILDVRTKEEFDSGHIKGATLIPDDQIGKLAEIMLRDKDQLIFVYCRSGRRSKNASAELASMGYSNIIEFGGIIEWPYEVVTD